MLDNMPDVAGWVNALGSRGARVRMPGSEAGLRLRSPFIDQENEQNQIITIVRMRWKAERNGLLSPRAGDVYSGALGYPLTRDAAEPIPALPEKMAESGEFDGAWCTLRRVDP